MNTNFRNNLKGWSIHGSINAIPNFALAYTFGWDRPESFAGMLIGVTLFILILTSISSSKFYTRKIKQGFLGEAVKYGRVIRSGMALIAMIGLSVKTLLLAFTDFYAGLLSSVFISWIFGFSDPNPDLGGNANFLMGDPGSLIPTIAITLVEGTILSVFMVLIAIPIVGIVRVLRKMKNT